MLDEASIIETVRRYVDDARDSVDFFHTKEKRTSATTEVHKGILLDDMQDMDDMLASSDFRSIEANVAKLFGLPEGFDTSAVEFRQACREWTRATRELRKYQLGLLKGQVSPTEVPYITPHQAHAGSREGHTSTRQSKRLNVSEALRRFLSDREKTQGITEGTSSGYRNIVGLFIELEGDAQVGHVDPEIATGYRDKLMEFPKNPKKGREYREKTGPELVAMEIPEGDRLAPRTVNNHMVHLSTVWTWLVRKQYAARNPFEGLGVVAEEKNYTPFEPEDLDVIFRSPLYTHGSRYFRSRATTAAKWWLLPLALYTGARAGELMQLRLEDVSAKDGVLVLSVLEDKKTGRRVKTKAALRDIPVHPRLLELGFVEYIEKLRTAGAARVLEGIPLVQGKASKAASRWYEDYRKHLPGFKEAGKVLHSTRGTFYKAAHEDAGIPSAILKPLVGHSQSEELGAGVAYIGKGPKVRRVFEELSKVEHDSEALRSLGRQWEDMPLFR